MQKLTLAYVQINRSAPWAKDPSFSGKGHEPCIRSPKLTTELQIDAWITEHAPEVFTNPTRHDIIMDDPDRRYTLTVARDSRQYFTTCEVQRYYDEGDDMQTTAPRITEHQAERLGVDLPPMECMQCHSTRAMCVCATHCAACWQPHESCECTPRVQVTKDGPAYLLPGVEPAPQVKGDATQTALF